MINLLFYISLLTLSLFAYLRLNDEDTVISSEEQEYLKIQHELKIMHQRKQYLNQMQENLKHQKQNQVYSKDIGLFVIQSQKINRDKDKIAIISKNQKTPLSDDKIA